MAGNSGSQILPPNPVHGPFLDGTFSVYLVSFIPHLIMLKEKHSFAYDNKGCMLLYFTKCAELLIHTRQTLCNSLNIIWTSFMAQKSEYWQCYFSKPFIVGK